MENISFLFGSGVSYYSSIPSINEITDLVISGNNITRETDNHYYINKPVNYLNDEHNKEYIQNNVILIQQIISTIDTFYSHMDHNHSTNYEDIYFVIRQICDSYQFEYENPAIIDLIIKLKHKLNLTDEDLREISIECVKYIECIIWRLIKKNDFVYNQFDILKRINHNDNIISIFSLNHDLVLEKFFKNTNITLDDGFMVKNRILPEWNGFNHRESTLKFLQLHGSINWFSAQLRNTTKRYTIMKVPNNIYPERLYEVHKDIDIGIGRPELLIGTFNKMWGYLGGIFEEQYFTFVNYLKTTDILIISGYGFGDKGINTKLSDWLRNSNSKKMIIIHPCRSQLVNDARGIFPLEFMSMKGIHPKISFIEKKFEEVNFDDISNCI